MELSEIRLKNIRSFESARLELRTGRTLIWGDVGAGKTSLLQAIEMALFGFAEVDASHLVRHRAPTAEVALTLAGDGHQYVFRRRFKRRMRQGRDVFEPEEAGTGLATDGSTVRYPPTELRQRAIDLLGFPDNPNPRAHSDLWRWAIYVPQERMREILEGSGAEDRLETVRKALGLERYRIAAENSQLLARDLRREATTRAEEAERLVHWEEELAHAEALFEAATSAIVQATGEEAEARSRLTTLEASEREVAAKAQRVEGDRRELAEVDRRLDEEGRSRAARDREILDGRARLAELDAEIERLGGAEKNVADRREALARAAARVAGAERESDRLDGLVRSWERDRSHREELRAAARESRSALDRAKAEQARTQERLAALPPEEAAPAAPARPIAEIDSEISGSVTEAERWAVERRSAETKASETRELVERGVCPQCGQAVEGAEFEVHLEELTVAAQAAQRAYEGAVNARARLVEERRVASEGEHLRALRVAAGARRHELEDELRSRGMEVERASSALARAEAGLSAPAPADVPGEDPTPARDQARAEMRIVGEERTLAERAVAEAERAEVERRAKTELRGTRSGALDRLTTEQERAAARVHELGERRRVLLEAIGAANTITQEAARISEESRRTRGEIERAVGTRRRAEGEAEGARRRIDDGRARVAERQMLLRRIRTLKDGSEFLSGPFRSALLEIEHRLLARAKGEFDRAFGRYFAALVEDPALVARSDPGFSPYVELEGEMTPPEALSGGERTALALAYRLALGDVVRALDRLTLTTLILDEPTDGFSPEQVERMGELLARIPVPQVIVVSHEIALEAAVDRVVRLRKSEGASEILGAAAEGSATAARGTAPRPTAEAPPP